MNLNPFSDRLEEEERKASKLASQLQLVTQEIEWFEGAELKKLVAGSKKLKSETKGYSGEVERLSVEISHLEKSLNSLSKSTNSLLNPKNWFDSRQRDLRKRAAKLKEELSKAKTDQATAKFRLEVTELAAEDAGSEIKKYKDFDLDEQIEQRSRLAKKLSQQKKRVALTLNSKQEVDAVLEPIMLQIKEITRKIIQATASKERAQSLDHDLSNAENSYERAMTHKICDEEFGTGSPKKVISQKDLELRRLGRDLQKLESRAKSVAKKAAREIKEIIIDGNNLCYEGDRFVGLEALKAFMPLLVDRYEVTLVFDATIRRALQSSDSKVRKFFESSATVHIVATNAKADETVLDLAGSKATTFIISNDRFSEYGEKSAVKHQRLIRHEIVSGRIFIHDLDISVAYQ